MSSLKFEIGKKYISYHYYGWVYECLGFMNGGRIILHARKEGQIDWVSYAKHDDLKNGLYEEYKELKKGTIYLNIYENSVYPYYDKDTANKRARPKRLACVKVDWTEGEGL